MKAEWTEDYTSSLPTGVKPTGDDGVYQVHSLTSNQWYRCDVTTLECDCPRAQKGITAQVRRQRGFIPYEWMCQHLKKAIAYDQMLLRMGKALEGVE